MKHLFNDISKEEKQRILEMHGAKRLISENIDPEIKQIADELLSAAKGHFGFVGTIEKNFVDTIRKIKSSHDFVELNNYFKSLGEIPLEDLIRSELDCQDNDDKYWLKEIDNHFSKNILRGEKIKFANCDKGYIFLPPQKMDVDCEEKFYIKLSIKNLIKKESYGPYNVVINETRMFNDMITFEAEVINEVSYSNKFYMRKFIGGIKCSKSVGEVLNFGSYEKMDDKPPVTLELIPTSEGLKKLKCKCDKFVYNLNNTSNQV